MSMSLVYATVVLVLDNDYNGKCFLIYTENIPNYIYIC